MEAPHGAETAPIGVFVIGSGRCGSSAAARLINLLGVPLSIPSDVLDRPTHDNAKGYWESDALVLANDELLERLGGSSLAPAAITLEAGDLLSGFREEARQTFRRVFPTPQWVWKDPRNSTTLPFWRELLRVPVVAVVIHREPLEVAASMEAAAGITKRHALALWERRSRAMLDGLNGIPTLVTYFDDLISEPVAWTRRTHEFLRTHDIAVTLPSDDDIRTFVDRGLRHQISRRAGVSGDLSAPQAALFSMIRSCEGDHASFPKVALPAESDWTEVILAEHRSRYARELERARDWLADQRDAWESEARRQETIVAELTRTKNELLLALVEHRPILRSLKATRAAWRGLWTSKRES